MSAQSWILSNARHSPQSLQSRPGRSASAPQAPSFAKPFGLDRRQDGWQRITEAIASEPALAGDGASAPFARGVRVTGVNDLSP